MPAPTYPVTFATGRSRTLTLTKSGSIGTLYWDQAAIVADSGPHQPYNGAANADLYWIIDANNPSFYLQVGCAGQGQYTSPFSLGCGTYGGAELLVSAACIVSGTTENVASSHGPSACYVDTTSNLSLTLGTTVSMSITVTVKEMQTIYYLASYDSSLVITNDGRNFPDYSSKYPGLCAGGYPDGIEALGTTFYEVIPAGNAATMTATINGTTSSYSYVFPSDTTVSYSFEDESLSQANGGGSISGSQSSSFQSLPLPGSNSQTVSDSFGSASASFGAGTISTSVSTIADSGGGVASVVHFVTAPYEYTVNLKGRYFNSSAPLIFDAQRGDAIAGPIADGTLISQYNESGTLQVIEGNNSLTYPIPTKTEIVPILVWLDENSLIASGDNISDWRCQFRGTAYESFTLAQAATTAAASNFSTTASGTLTLTATEWGGFRYLTFSADQNGSLAILSKDGITKTYTWSVTTAGTAQAITLDLCSPSSWSAGTLPSYDNRDSYYPLNAAGTAPDETTPGANAKGAYWGPLSISTVTVTNSGAGGSTLHLTSVNLERTTDAKATFLPTFATGYVLNQTGSSALIQPYCTLLSDGKAVIDAPALTHIPGTGWSDFTLTDLISTINLFSGWTATAAASFPDTYHTNDLPASLAWGSGAVFRSGAWSYGVDLDATATLTVYAQDLFDEVQGYPGIGNPWDGSGYPSPGSDTSLPLNVTKFLRGRGYGLTFGPSQTVYANQGQLTVVSDSQGEYTFGSPYVKDGVTVKESLGAPPTSGTLSEYVAHNRHSSRMALVQAAVGMPGILDISEENMMVLFGIPASGAPIVHNSVSSVPTNWDETVTTNLPAAPFSFQFCIGPDRSIYAAYIGATNQVNAVVSHDDGATFAAMSGFPVTITNVQQLAIRISTDNDILILGYVPTSGTSGPGTIQMVQILAGNPTPSSPTAILDQTGAAIQTDGTGFSFDWGAGGDNLLSLVLVKPGGSSFSMYQSATLGKNWKEVI